MGTRVLLTGGSGFLGCYVMQTLIVRDLIPNADIEVGPGLTEWN
jgi:thioester reductase-like protein